jgi:hypothetical protein
LNMIIRGPCHHAQAERRYRPGRKLQHLVNARNTRCTAPGCGQPAATWTTPLPGTTADLPVPVTSRRCAGITIDASRRRAGGWSSPNPASWSGAPPPGAPTPPPPPGTPASHGRAVDRGEAAGWSSGERPRYPVPSRGPLASSCCG